MAFEKENSPENEAKASEIALKLDEIALNNDIGVLEKAIRHMGQNTRETLKRALEMSERS